MKRSISVARFDLLLNLQVHMAEAVASDVQRPKFVKAELRDSTDETLDLPSEFFAESFDKAIAVIQSLFASAIPKSEKASRYFRVEDESDKNRLLVLIDPSKFQLLQEMKPTNYELAVWLNNGPMFERRPNFGFQYTFRTVDFEVEATSSPTHTIRFETDLC